MENIPIVPGRGLNTPSAVTSRKEFLASQGYTIENIASHHIDLTDIQNKIESFVGTVEIPVGIVGPLLYNQNNKKELVYCLAATLEGALIASMNRGARAISNSEGFNAIVIHQKMVRTPAFIFENMNESYIFKLWIDNHFQYIKEVAEHHSNHARLLSTSTYIIGRTTHIKFVYSTGDASGQNMTTTCTWHAMLWIVDNFEKETNIKIQKYIIEGNGASDKKVSQYAVGEGRGVHVTAECFLSEKVINTILRTTSDDMAAFFSSSIAMTSIDGMRGYNINVANAIAAIFASTGQDLGSIHESANGILNLEKTADGLYLSLNLPSLVIGTVGGGTQIARQKESLELMGCSGNGKIERFASLIAGFALGLEISTYAAIVGGQFAKAHEKLGRNKPVNWLLKSELTKDFIISCLTDTFSSKYIDTVIINNQQPIDNGIITNITNQVSKKMMGFIPLTVTLNENKGSTEKDLLIKSKALDIDVIQGLHRMASTIDPELSDLLSEYKENLEYWGCHVKEIQLYKTLHSMNYPYIPSFYGHMMNAKREIYLIIMERLNNNDILHINSQKTPEKWTNKQIENTITAITEVHQFFQKDQNKTKIHEIKLFEPWKSIPLYNKLVTLMQREIIDHAKKQELEKTLCFILNLHNEFKDLHIPLTIIHNDFNPRNIAIRNNGQPCIYDWELSVINIPHRDIIEFLSFVLVSDFSDETFIQYLRFHYNLYQPIVLSWEEWKKGYIYSLKEYLVTRISFYEVAGIHARYAFSERILNNSLRMLEILI